LAKVEAKITMIEFIRKFKVKLSDGYKLVMDHKAIYAPTEHVLLDLELIN